MIKNILRIVVALIFLASGFVKAVDVVGFSFKLEEYFSPAVFGLPFFEKQALPLAIIVVVTELVLGFMLLIKVKLRATLIALIAMCVFFAFLTFYSAYFNVVTDCGCFGDALTMTPWQSFWKDIALLVALFVLYRLFRNEFKQEGRNKPIKTYGSVAAFALMIAVIYWGVAHEPLIDFRDYKIGTNLLNEKRKIQQNPSEYKTFYTLQNKQTGEQLELNQDEYVSDKKYWETGSPWTIDESKTASKLTRQGYDSEISKFKPETPEGSEITDQIFRAPHAVLIFVYNPKKADRETVARAEAKAQQEKGALVYGISTDPQIFQSVPRAMMDGTAIKTIARSNPFVLTLRHGTIVGKEAAHDYIK